MRGEGNCEDWGLICGGIRAEGARTPAAWLLPTAVQGRVFLLNSCLIRWIHLLSLNREDYLTAKQGLDLIPKPNPNGPPGPSDP
jgi:hypothetical protein